MVQFDDSFVRRSTAQYGAVRRSTAQYAAKHDATYRVVGPLNIVAPPGQLRAVKNCQSRNDSQSTNEPSQNESSSAFLNDHSPTLKEKRAEYGYA